MALLGGGRLQRRRALEAHDAADRDEPASKSIIDSVLVRRLLRDWSWGHKSAVEVQQLCLASYNDLKDIGCEDKIPSSLKAIASAGQWGKNERHVHNKIISMLGQPVNPPPMSLDITCAVLKPKPEQSPVMRVSLPFFLPHCMLSFMYHHDRPYFDKELCGGSLDDPGLKPFWTEVVRRRDPRIKRHDMCPRPLWHDGWRAQCSNVIFAFNVLCLEHDILYSARS